MSIVGSSHPLNIKLKINQFNFDLKEIEGSSRAKEANDGDIRSHQDIVGLQFKDFY